MRETWRRLGLVLIVLLMLGNARVQAQSSDMGAKASLIFRCAKYMDWPTEKMKPNAPFVIGVMGSEEMAGLLTDNSSKPFLGRQVIVKQIAQPQEIAGCHVLFIGPAEANRQKALLNEARRGSVLTFGESENFEKDGGVITFVKVGSDVKYNFNARNCGRADLKASSEVKDMAAKVNDR